MPESARSGGTAVLGLKADLDTLNPYLSPQATTRDIAYQIYETLMVEQADFGQGPPTFLPRLAASWEVSEDGKEVTFHLRPGAVWTDGRPVTAADVRFSWQAAIHPEVGWVAADTKEIIKDVIVVDDSTVTFRLNHVSPYQLMDINDGVILPRHIWEPIPYSRWRTSEFARRPVSSGPFRLDEWRPNQSLKLVRNEGYRDGSRPLLAGVVFRIVPDAASGLQQLLAGELDYWDAVPARDLPRLQSSSRVEVHQYQDRHYTFIAWNCARPLFSEARVRQALTLAIDRQRITRDIMFGAATVASGPLPPLYWAHNSDVSPLPHDPARARQLLADAGWQDTDQDGWLDRDGTDFSFQLETSSAVRQDIAILVQEDLGKIGVKVQPVALESSVFAGRHQQHDFDAFIGGWRLPTRVDLSDMFSTDAITGSVNYGSFSHAGLDELLRRSLSVADFRDAKPFFDDAQTILRQEQPYTFLFWRDRLVGFGSRLRDVVANAQSPLFNLDEWWIPPGERTF